MAADEPDQIRREIEDTQRALSADVDTLTDKVNPSRVVRHRMKGVQNRVGRVRGVLTSMRDTIMGSASSGVSRAGDTITSAASNVRESTSAAAATAAGAVESTPQAVRRQTQGNPLAAGLVAFGAGWLVSSLLPATRREQDAVTRVEDVVREHGQPVGEQLSQVAAQMKDNLREPAHQAAESVRSSAGHAASRLSDEARSAAEDVTGRAREAKDTVREQAESSGS
ncbi:MAG: DUF3618 domain-containing protein [Actinomycetota bacterium]|nr:DUF3618 domain-containing protein [Actinomycetota bacterium]